MSGSRIHRQSSLYVILECFHSRLTGLDSLILVCRTCSDYNHTCLGYSDPPAHTRSQSDTATRRPAIPAPSEAVNPRDTRAVESHSPEPSPRPRVLTDRGGQSSGIPELKDPGKPSSYNDASSRIDTDAEQQAAEGSPDSGKLETWPCLAAKRTWSGLY